MKKILSLFIVLLITPMKLMANPFCADFKGDVAIELKFPDMTWDNNPNWRSAVVKLPRTVNGRELSSIDLRSMGQPDIIIPLRNFKEPWFEAFQKDQNYYYSYVTMDKMLFDGRYCITATYSSLKVIDGVVKVNSGFVVLDINKPLQQKPSSVENTTSKSN